MKHSCDTYQHVTHMKHSCDTYQHVTHMKHSCDTYQPVDMRCHSYETWNRDHATHELVNKLICDTWTCQLVDMWHMNLSTCWYVTHGLVNLLICDTWTCQLVDMWHMNLSTCWYVMSLIWNSHDSYEAFISHISTCSNVWHDCSYVDMCDMPTAYEWHESLMCAVTWVNTHAYVWQDSFVCVTSLIHVRDFFIRVTWLLHKRDMTHRCVWQY